MTLILIDVIAGACGGLIKEIVEDNKLILPNICAQEFQLGFMGTMLIGAFVGAVIDGGWIEAALAGYVGFAVIQKLLPLKENKTT